MPRTVVLGLCCLSLFLLFFPLTLVKPGLPATLKADESAYYLMALSLAHDGDLRLETEDQERLFAEFPFRWSSNLIVMTDDGWKTAFYGKPFIYSLFASPFAYLFGANGMVFFNMALLVAMMWLGTLHLKRYNDPALAALFACGFFLLSSAFAYVFWLQTEVFNMAAIAFCLYLGLHRSPTSKAGDPSQADARTDTKKDPFPKLAPRKTRWRRLALLGMVVSGASLALAVYNKPVFLAFCLPILVSQVRRRRWSSAAAWVLGLALGLGGTAGLSVALTGHPSPYLGVARQGVTVCEPDTLPVKPIVREDPKAGAIKGTGSPTGNAWWWLFRIPDLAPAELAENFSYFLWGRHTGLLLYLPFAALAVLLFLFHGRRSLEGWSLLAALVIVGAFFVIFIPFNWHGGGGFIGNRYFVNVYPAFLFLITSLKPRWFLPVGFSLAGIFLAPILFTPLVTPGPEPTLQAHVRNAPFRFFPLELSLRNVPGYHRRPIVDGRVIGRKDQVLPHGERLWLRGADRVELWMVTSNPIDQAVFQLRNLAPENRFEVEMEEAREVLEFQTGEEVRRITLVPGRPGRVRYKQGVPFYIYRLTVASQWGRVRTWTRHYPPNRCPQFAHNETHNESFYTGAILNYLGDGALLEAELYDLRWGDISPPGQVRAGDRFFLPVNLANASGEDWPNRGPARVKLSYHWLDEAGETLHFDGLRTELEEVVAAGAEASLEMEIEAPEEPGRYLLELEPVFEHVAWFSQKGAPTQRLTVEVAPPRAPTSGPVDSPQVGEEESSQGEPGKTP
ncbi:MAG: hypothetical protein K0U98_25540 [Deltaproteobacteria bacterium]|nr:hypothetical protein [Deltaproteobacteria bacterium]